jgi:hypothetical protein
LGERDHANPDLALVRGAMVETSPAMSNWWTAMKSFTANDLA